MMATRFEKQFYLQCVEAVDWKRGVPRVNATSGRTLISDNKETQQISVTVQKLEKPDTGVYWCGVYFNYTKEVQIMKRIVLRISEDFTNFRVRMPTASTDESQDEDIKDNSEGASSLLAMTPGMVTAFFAGILLGKVLVAVAGYMIMKRRATMERGKNTRKRERKAPHQWLFRSEGISIQQRPPFWREVFCETRTEEPDCENVSTFTLSTSRNSFITLSASGHSKY
ncbi:hypothetical protein NDU88_004252 [Pleurodeles waltl]|uniref:Immunoglobulin V-set domain-containing protein n=1 Tax=Pleurodeles waltl TaxID=8319 RepID=A0AAV7QBD5_PLEWA|nr:hypothetical protein NDU88_004252 [Pleurodeles waltl]